MARLVAVPHSMIVNKPSHGAACTRCGACCYAMQCSFSRRLLGPKPGPCNALRRQEDGTYACGIIEEAEKEDKELAAAAALIIGTGMGCDARFNGEPGDPNFYARLDRHRAEKIKDIKAAYALWGMEEEKP